MSKIKPRKEEDMRESPSGLSFYSLYQVCPRKFYIKYINGLQPLITSPPLLFGSAFHEGAKLYWEGPYNSDAFIQGFDATMQSSKDKYDDIAKYDEDFSKGHYLIDAWLSTHHDENQERYVPLAVEEEMNIKIGPNEDFKFTIRPDLIVKDKQFEKNIIWDFKTTGWSLSNVFKTNELGDQLTAYIWGTNKVHPEWKIETAQIDCAYGRGRKFECQRGLEIYRSKKELALFEMSLYGLILEVSQKYKSLTKYSWPLLFPRNGKVCFQYNKPCEYAKVCRMNIPIGVVPPGFKLDEWATLDGDMKKAQGSFGMENFEIGGKG